MTPTLQLLLNAPGGDQAWSLDARGVDRAGREGLHRALWRAFREHPWRFLGPPRGETGCK